MIAPDLTTLFDFDQIEPLLVAALEANLTVAGVSLARKRALKQLALPRVEVQLEIGAAQGWRFPYNGTAWLAAYNGVLKCRIITQRERDNQPVDPMEHRLLVAQLRRFLQIAANVFRKEYFPYHTLTKVVESGTVTGVLNAEEGGVDFSEIKFDVLVGIRTDAWPAISEDPAFALQTESGEVILSESGEVLATEAF